MFAFVLAFSVSLAFCYATYDPISPRVNVRWSEDVTPRQRVALEAAYRLAQPEYADGTTWSYGLLDISTGNIQRLVQDPAVDDTHMIERRTFELTEPPPTLLFVLLWFLVWSSIVGVTVRLVLALLRAVVAGISQGERWSPNEARGTDRQILCLPRGCFLFLHADGMGLLCHQTLVHVPAHDVGDVLHSRHDPVGAGCRRCSVLGCRHLVPGRRAPACGR